MASAPDRLPEFKLERVFAAPREALWAAWTQPARLEQWFGPKGCQAVSVKFDLRPGGMALTKLVLPGKPPLHARFIFREITPPKRLVWLHAVADAAGNATKHPMAQALPAQMLVVMELAAEGEQTRLTLVKTPFEATAAEVDAFRDAIEGMSWGWSGNFDVLDEYLVRPSPRVRPPSD
jgi:uncharacterized protein YndB with AHSA1/START domain